MSSPISLDDKADTAGKAREWFFETGIDTPHSAKPGRIARFDNAVTAFEMLADLLAVALAAVISYGFYRTLHLGNHVHYQAHEYLAAVLAFGIFFVLMLDRNGAYLPGNSLLRVRETERVLRVSAQSFLFVFFVSFLTQLYFPRWLIIIAFVLVPLFVIIEKHGIHLLVRDLHSKGHGVRKIVIYGAGDTGRRVFSALVRSPKLGLCPVAFVDEDPARVGTNIYELSYQRRRSAPVLAGPLTKEVLNHCNASQVVIAIPSLSRERFLNIVSEALSANARVSFVPNHFLPSDAPIDHVDIDGLLLSSISKPKVRPGYRFLKRAVDALLSIILLFLLAPLLIIIGILIRCGSPGPAIFRQKRVGQNGRVFELYKFRTMHVDACPYDYSPRASEDGRITRIGKFLRRTSLDELPQLFNVIKGQMSLVGPRPEMPFIVQSYGPTQLQRLQVKPGLTGLWQLSADRGYLIHENIAYDMYYIKNRNLFMDIAILMHTIFFAMRGV